MDWFRSVPSCASLDVLGIRQLAIAIDLFIVCFALAAMRFTGRTMSCSDVAARSALSHVAAYPTILSKPSSVSVLPQAC